MEEGDLGEKVTPKNTHTHTPHTKGKHKYAVKDRKVSQANSFFNSKMK